VACLLQHPWPRVLQQRVRVPTQVLLPLLLLELLLLLLLELLLQLCLGAAQPLLLLLELLLLLLLSCRAGEAWPGRCTLEAGEALLQGPPKGGWASQRRPYLATRAGRALAAERAAVLALRDAAQGPDPKS
jgi:hypothetical protein